MTGPKVPRLDVAPARGGSKHLPEPPCHDRCRYKDMHSCLLERNILWHLLRRIGRCLAASLLATTNRDDGPSKHQGSVGAERLALAKEVERRETARECNSMLSYFCFFCI